MKSIFCLFASTFLLFFSVCSAQELGDDQILNVMLTVDKGEIAASKDALKKKLSPSVDEYAKYLIQQHQKNQDELNKLSKQLGLEPKESDISKSLVNDGKKEHEKLEKLHDKAFDKAFIDAMVKDHQDGLKLIESKLLPRAKNPELKVAVEKFRDMVSTHLQKAQEIQKSL